MKKIILSVFVILILLLPACGKMTTVKSVEGDVSREKSISATKVKNEKEKSGVYAIITKSAGNPYFGKLVDSFVSVIQSKGYNVIVKQPTVATAEAQISLINELVAQNVDGIAISANDYDSLTIALNSAMAHGIHCICYDSATNPAAREIFVNQAGTNEIAQSLVDAVYDLTNGDGEWAILSATTTATNQNQWISAMKDIIKDDKYKNMQLVDIVYGNDEQQKSVDETNALLQNHPNLKVICSPTTVGISASSKVVKESFANNKVKVTGLGLPSEMAEFILGDNAVCPYMYLWNPIEIGKITAYTLLEINENNFDCTKIDNSFSIDNITYNVVKSSDNGTEIIIGPPYKFDKNNINDWKDIY